MIEAHGLTKKYGEKTAVDDISFTVRPGIVTGFLGPNGAGKSTTMRMIMGLDRPTAGTVTVNGRRYAQHASPLSQVGALLEARAVHPGRSAYQHLKVLAATHNIPAQRVHDVIGLTGLESVAKKRVGGFSLGMGQRLGIASALLGDPSTLILDEPVNGLDPEGVLWVRNLARYLASQGRTVFLSSHLMSEMALTADLVESASKRSVRVRTPRLSTLLPAVEAAGGVVRLSDDGAPEGDKVATVTGLDSPAIGEIALTNGIVLHELTPVASTLEEAYMELTADAVEYHAVDIHTPNTDGGQR